MIPNFGLTVLLFGNEADTLCGCAMRKEAAASAVCCAATLFLMHPERVRRMKNEKILPNALLQSLKFNLCSHPHFVCVSVALPLCFFNKMKAADNRVTRLAFLVLCQRVNELTGQVPRRDASNQFTRRVRD